MTLSDFATFSTAVSGLAVTASLIYLALQTHQNAKHTKALIHQGRVAAIRELLVANADTDIAAAVIAATGGAPTPEAVRQRQFVSMCGASLYGWQDTLSQYQNGLLDEDFFQQMRGAVVQAVSQPAFCAAWESFFRVPGTRFAAFVDEIISTLPAGRS